MKLKKPCMPAKATFTRLHASHLVAVAALLLVPSVSGMLAFEEPFDNLDHWPHVISSGDWTGEMPPRVSDGKLQLELDAPSNRIGLKTTHHRDFNFFEQALRISVKDIKITVGEGLTDQFLFGLSSNENNSWIGSGSEGHAFIYANYRRGASASNLRIRAQNAFGGDRTQTWDFSDLNLPRELGRADFVIGPRDWTFTWYDTNLQPIDSVSGSWKPKRSEWQSFAMAVELHQSTTRTALLEIGAVEVAWGFTNLGAAVPASRSFGGTMVENSTGERMLLVWLGDATGTTSKLVIDVENGEYQQIDFKIGRRDTARGLLLASNNRWYSQFGDRFFEFCPDEREFTLIGVTQDQRSYALTEDNAGVIWGVHHPGGGIISYDTTSGDLQYHGPINEEGWPQYARTLVASDDGWLYAGIGTVEAQVAAFNKHTGERRQLLTSEERLRGTGTVMRGIDGDLYANAPQWGWHRLENGTAVPIEEEPPEEAPETAGYTEIVVDQFPDGTRLVDLNVPSRKVVFADGSGVERTFAFDYHSGGAHLYSLIQGPDGTLYGGSGHPTHLFQLNPATAEIEDRHMYEGSHFNALAFQGPHLYAARYAGGSLYRYDPLQPWNPGTNPEQILESARELSRPTVLLAYPDGRHLVMAGSPRGGRTAAGIVIFDVVGMSTTDILNEDLLPDLNTVALLPLHNGNLLGATTTRPGTGGEQRAEIAELYVFCWDTHAVLWRNAVLDDNEGFRDMIFGPDGMVYGLTLDSRLFVFDPNNLEMIHEETLAAYGTPSGSQAPRTMAVGTDGNIYALFRDGITVIKPGTFDHSLVLNSPDEIRMGVVIHDGRIFFGSRETLYSHRIHGSQDDTVRTYADWGRVHFTPDQRADPATAGPMGSPARDSMPNLLKYAFDINPWLPVNGGSLPKIEINPDGMTTHISYGERRNALDIEYLPQISDDLIQWHPVSWEKISHSPDPKREDFDIIVITPGIPAPGERTFLRVEVKTR